MLKKLKGLRGCIGFSGWYCLLPLLLISWESLFASTIHFIDFGGAIHGFTYSPNFINIEVGDTIVWRGDFSQFPLVLTSIPSGANPISQVNTGMSFSYPVEVAGNYSYQTPIYAGIGMKGSFSAQFLPHGSLTNEGTDFYLGLLTPSYNYASSDGYHAYAVITTYYDNAVTVSYFDASGNEKNSTTKLIPRRNSLPLELDLSSLRIDTIAETVQYKTCHITSKYPISIQFISIGVNSGGSYLALPALALGKNYVAASYYDNPGNGALTGFSGLPLIGENASGSFLVIGTQDGTNITIVPTTATTGGHTGVNTGSGATGIPHPFSVALNKGQCYLVRSMGKDAGADISGSIIQSTRPIAVISGHEDADVGGLIPSFSNLTDGRDYMIEQMLPVEYWDSAGYLSLPFREAIPPSDEGGNGDTYRVYGFDAGNAVTTADVVGIPGGYPMSASRYHYAEHLDIIDPVDIYSTNGKKIGVTQYDERSQPAMGLDPSPSMMTIIPHSRWRTSYDFSLLQSKTIDGVSEDQYVNIIADSLSDIRVSNDGSPLVPIATAFNQLTLFTNISKHYQVTGGQYRIGAGSFYLHSDFPFVAYTYGMNKIVEQMLFTFNFENAAPAGTQLNTGAVPSFKISIDTLSNCAGWTICVRDTGIYDPGVKAVMLVDDTEGVYFDRPGMKFSNAAFDVTSPAYNSGELHPDYHSQAPYCFDVKFTNPLAASIAPVCIIDNLGNGMILRLVRSAPTIALSTSPVASANPDSLFFPQQKIGDEICTTFVVKNTAAIGGEAILLNAANLKKGDAAYDIRSVAPPLPFLIRAQDSVSIELCFTSKDSLRHRDSLILQTDCFSIPVSLDAHGATGLISAGDLSFGGIKTGDTLCKVIVIKNIGSESFTLRSFVLSDTADFTIDASALPALIKAGSSISIDICFHPKADGSYTAGIDWSTDLEAAFAHSVKSHSTITGTASPKADVKPASAARSFSISPNPASGNFMVMTFSAIPSAGNTTLSIFDILGREVFHHAIPPDLNQAEIPIGNLPEGVYSVQLSSPSGTVSQKFVRAK